LWLKYKDVDLAPILGTMTAPLNDDKDWLNAPDNTPIANQLWLYEHKPRPQILTYSSLIPYWISKLPVWPQLARMALDVFSTPPMSDEPERVFSIAGNLLSPRRRKMKGESVEQLLCLRSWQKSSIITLDQRMMKQAIEASCDDSEVITNTNNFIYLDSDDED
jgi:hypothetical protein